MEYILLLALFISITRPVQEIEVGLRIAALVGPPG